VRERGAVDAVISEFDGLATRVASRSSRFGTVDEGQERSTTAFTNPSSFSVAAANASGTASSAIDVERARPPRRPGRA
jgi:hypothetical protein